MKAADTRKLRERDLWCWHCGDSDNLVPHHIQNRGMGGSKVLDNLQNVILVCAEYNGRMESDSLIAGYARDNGHKSSKFSAPGHPILDTTRSTWYTLDKAGNKTECKPPSYLI